MLWNKIIFKNVEAADSQDLCIKALFQIEIQFKLNQCNSALQVAR